MNIVAKPSEYKPYHKGYTARDAAHLDFVAWDGEGITFPGQSRQSFVLFGNSKGSYVSSQRLTTEECLQVILDTEQQYPKAIHVGFAFSYDTEMILVDLAPRYLEILRRKGYVKWRSYRIEYRKGKWLQITKRIKDENVTARIWDVWSFFSTSFIVAVREYLGERDELTAITAGKTSRGSFTWDDMNDFIIPYWRTELQLTVELMNSLRERLYGAGLKIRQWHGPGAIATFAMRQRNVANAMNRELPDDLRDAAQYGYAGGRFELFKLGRVNKPVYAYDIRSAYPAAIAQLPNLATGQWEHVLRPTSIAAHGIYHIRFRHRELMTGKPMPFFFRDERHAIHFPNVVEGWYWESEARITQILGNSAEVLEGWVYHSDGSTPLSWLYDTYQTRARWKRDNNPSQLALKLLMNSMYGKFAQRVGWERFSGPPRWHQLEWAGMITSAARAKLFAAMLQAHGKGALIGVETDGIFSSEPLTLDVGPDLGQWEATILEDMIYLQSGFYFKRENGKWTAKYRGFDRGSITVDDALAALSNWKPWNDTTGKLVGTCTRFSTMGSYLRTEHPEELRNRWMTVPRELSLGGDGKRVHRSFACPECSDHISPADIPHTMTISRPVGGQSKPHNLPWRTDEINPFREFDDEGIAPHELW